MSLARLIETKTHLMAGKLQITEFIFQVPIDYTNPDLGSIQLFARSATKYEKPAKLATDEENRKSLQKPWLVYLQGGPGYGCPSPQNSNITSTILEKGYQMLYLDQRGTGQSNPITVESLLLRGNTQEQFDYLKHFRADNIVRDCEAVRKVLTKNYPTELEKWSLFGQSFGGFCAFTYLSKYPDGLREAFITGGIPPIGCSPDDVYQATYKKLIERNKIYYDKYPEDVPVVNKVVTHIKSLKGISLPSGIKLTVRLFLTLGRNFGFHGGLDSVHNIVLRAKTDIAQTGSISRPTLSVIEGALSFENNVLYAILHEAIYCERLASNWAADRVGKKLEKFEWLSRWPNPMSETQDAAIYFSGEMIYPFLFDISPDLKMISDLAEKIASYSDWPELYDKFQLSRNEVPIYAATFIDDMYVDFNLTQRTVQSVKNCKQFITNSMYHNAISSKTTDVVKELFALRDDTLD
ncbi:BgTH12-06033 [Blumeria graminis f. sp. triticale]|uniref:Bgt-619 n=3 Tax=Blumeria graminis TaxID=34373 RepID=A0A381LB16_BLUGR|nr:hypothetical protein BGT96224_619 [Blumeria graminis f. sp. tritici 96224]CAD6504301.1 BgTH12-06033 [Blumeria graminis f. sp. triticale]VDB91114.1 Bgt-619 [Blumeria graminis f. sp. tritici]